MARIAIALLAVCCLAALVASQPLNDDDLLVRARRSPAGVYRGGVRRRFRPTTLYAARSRDAPAYAAPEEGEEAPSVNSGEEVVQDEPIEEPVAPVSRLGARGRPQRPAASAEQEDGGAPPAYGNGNRQGTNAIATSYSRGDGASSNSHAVAYGGQFSGGQFKHRFNKQ